MSSSSLSHLTDDSLLTILSYLPVCELLQAHCLTKRLGKLASFTARHRPSLLIDDGTWPVSYFTYTISPTHAHYLPEGSHRRRRLSAAHPLVLRLYQRGVLSRGKATHPLQTIAPLLVIPFPSIRRLYVSVKGDAPTLQTIIFLVSTWAFKLTRLHVRYEMTPPRTSLPPMEDGDPTTEEDAWVRFIYGSLLGTINNLQGCPLRHLHLDIILSVFFNIEQHMGRQMPITRQLASLYLRTGRTGYRYRQRDGRFQLEELATSWNPVTFPLLQRFAFDDYGATLEKLLQVPASLASRQAKLIIDDRITEGNIRIFTHLCSRWVSLEDLSLTFDLSLSRLVEAMAPLTKLAHLHLTHLRYIQTVDLPAEPTPVRHTLPSVGSLTLTLGLPRHAHMERLSLGGYFPAVKLTWLRHLTNTCSDCGTRWLPDFEIEAHPSLSGFNEPLVARCDTVALETLRRCVPQLEVTLHKRRITWSDFEANFTIQKAPWK